MQWRRNSKIHFDKEILTAIWRCQKQLHEIEARRNMYIFAALYDAIMWQFIRNEWMYSVCVRGARVHPKNQTVTYSCDLRRMAKIDGENFFLISLGRSGMDACVLYASICEKYFCRATVCAVHGCFHLPTWTETKKKTLSSICVCFWHHGVSINFFLPSSASFRLLFVRMRFGLDAEKTRIETPIVGGNIKRRASRACVEERRDEEADARTLL